MPINEIHGEIGFRQLGRLKMIKIIKSRILIDFIHMPEFSF